MEAKKSKTVFVEYSTADKGQHFMTVVQNQNHQRIIIGRIYREYDSESKKYKYYATDFANNQVFADYKDLHAIKKQFIEHGESLAYAVPVNPNRAKQSERLVLSHKDERAAELKGVRDKKSSEKVRTTSKQNPEAKITEDQKEKEQDERNTERYVEERNQEEQQDIASERMDELEELRDQGDDREQDMEIDR